MKTTLLTLSLLFSFKALAGLPAMEITNHKQLAASEFLKSANSPESEVGLVIARENADNTDGRNPEGSILLPVKNEHIQVAFLWAEEMLNPWHYAVLSDDGLTCTAGGDSVSFLVLLSSNYSVHMAREFETVPFIVSTSENFVAQKKDGSKIEYCEDVAWDEKEEFKVTASLSVDRIKEQVIKDPE